MKNLKFKTIVIALMFAIITPLTLFAATGATKLNATVQDTAYVFSLFYDTIALENYDAEGLFADSDKANLKGTVRWDLKNTTPTSTKAFSINANGNVATATGYKVSVTASPFKGGVNNIETTITPSVTLTKGTLTGSTISGYQKDAEICSFNLGWTGSETIDAGN